MTSRSLPDIVGEAVRATLEEDAEELANLQ